MKLNQESTVQEILKTNFSAGKILAEEGIPFAFYLKFSLSKICSKRNKDPEKILQKIEELEVYPSIDFFNQPVKTLIEKISLEYHDYSRKRLALAEKYLMSLVEEYKFVFPKILEIEEAFLEFVEEYESHLLKEEQAIFPEIINLDELLNSAEDSLLIVKPDSLEIPLENMERQHIEQEQNLEIIFRDAENLLKLNPEHIHCKKYFSEIQEFYVNTSYHVYIENEILFKRARRIENSFYFKAAGS